MKTAKFKVGSKYWGITPDNYIKQGELLSIRYWHFQGTLVPGTITLLSSDGQIFVVHDLFSTKKALINSLR